MKERSRYLKTMPVFAVALLLLAGTGFAALLTHYGQVTGDVTVSQSVLVDGEPYSATSLTYTPDTVTAGSTQTSDVHYVKNNAEIDATIQLSTTCQNSIGYDDGTQTSMRINWSDVGGWREECDGIVTSYVGVLELTSKNANWQPTDDMKATLYYSLTGNEFGYDLEATGLTANIDYSLIYYADKPNRFVEWGGNNPGALIATATSDVNGDLITIGNKNLGMNLPSFNDANIDEYNYCLSKVDGGTGDMYIHCHGAKLWLIPSVDYDENTQKITGPWDRTKNLYETDLITYTKTADNTVVLPANGGGFNFVLENQYALDVAADVYTITTFIDPVL